MKKIHKSRAAGRDTTAEQKDPLMAFVRSSIADLPADDCKLLQRVSDCVNSFTGNDTMRSETLLSLPFVFIQSSFPSYRTTSVMNNASVLCGMHADQCTEAIVDEALKAKRAFAVVPCCIFKELYPKYVNDVRVDTYPLFLEYLQAKHPAIQKATLPFIGRNIVLFMKVEDYL